MTASTGVLAALLSTALRATLLLALAAAAERTLLRRASAAARHLLWTFALGGALLLPGLAPVLPAWRLPLPAASVLARRPHPAVPPSKGKVTRPAPRAAVPSATAQVGGDLSPAAAPRSVQPTNAARPASGARTAPRVSLAALLAGMYAAGVLLLLVRVVAEQLTVRELARGAAPVRGEEWDALARALGASLGVRRRVRLLRAAGPAMPLTWGVVRPTILLPATADAWSAARRRAVLLHELAHVARHDCLTQTLAALACALYWPHPGVWWAAARMRAERELACDDRAMAGGVRPHDYAAHLLAVARAVQPARPLRAVALAMAAPSQLESRIRAAIDGGRARTAPGRAATALGALLTALLLLALASVRAGAAPASRAAVPVRAAPVVVAPADVLPDARPDAGAFGGAWALLLEAEPGAPAADGLTAHVLLSAPGLNTFYIPLRRLDGLTAAMIAADTADVRFRLRRDAGTLAFTGTFRGGRGKGRFEFIPDPAFADELVRRGMEPPTEAQQFTLARHGTDLDLLDALARYGYARPTTREYVRASMTSADARYVGEMAELGYRLGTLGALLRLSDEGVNPQYIGWLAAAGYRDLPAADLVRLRNEEVTPDFIARANERAGRRLGVDELVALRLRGAESPAPRTGAEADGSRDGSTPYGGRWTVRRVADDRAEIELFWDDGTNWRRWIPAATLREAAPPLAFRIDRDPGSFEFEGSGEAGARSGTFRFVPHREFVATMRALGVRGLEGATDHQLKNLAFGDMSAAALREFTALFGGPLALGDATELAIRFVTPDYVRALQSLGVSGANTVPVVTELAFLGLPISYVRELDAAGYRGLTGDQLLALRRAGVTADFIRQLQSGGTRAATPEELIERRRRGGRP